MTVLRIVANIAVEQPAAARSFYEDVLGLKQVMDLGFIRTFSNERESRGRR